MMHFAKLVRKLHRSKDIVPLRFLASQAQAAVDVNAEGSSDINPLDSWANARPFESIPGPSKYALFRGFLPGGVFYKKSLLGIYKQCRTDFGEVFMLPGIFGKRNVVFTFNPDDYQKIYRTEGVQPVRRGVDILHYYRKVHRKEIFKHAGGLVAEQDEGWAHFRSTVNPVMMNSKTIQLYAPKMNNIVNEFILRIRNVRDPYTNEVPANFEDDLNNWAMDSVSLVALDTELGLLNHSERNPKAKEVITGMRVFFELLFELDIQPSLWKYIPTPAFRRLIETFDKITDLSIFYIDEALERVKNDSRTNKPDFEKSVLERLLNIDRTVAIVMAMDIFLAGVDTTTSAITGCLLSLAKNPEKQAKLREEIMGILPSKDDPLTVEKMKHLPYLRACIKEAMRVYSVATSNFRATGQDIVLSGYQVPKKTDIAMPFQLLLDDPKYYVRPNDFLPERWLRKEKSDPDSGDSCPVAKNVNPFLFLPFGFGPRMCIGKRMVDLELEIVISRLIRNFHLSYEHSTENAFKTHIINVPGIPLQFKFADVD